MPATNYVHGVLTPEKLRELFTALRTIRETLSFAVNLTPEERGSLPKMGDKSIAFVQKAGAAAENNPRAIPASIDIPGFAGDKVLFDTLYPFVSEYRQVGELLNDTMLALGADLYTQALTIYGVLKVAGQAEGLDELRESMAQRFQKRPKADATLPAA